MTYDIYKQGLYSYIEQRAIDLRETMPEYNDEFDPIYDDLVIYDGLFPSQLFIVGRDLGQEEVTKKKPFIGQSGKLVRQTMKVAGINENNVYITNIVPFKPIHNKVFSPEVRKEFGKLLNVQIKIGKPKYIVATGRESIEHFINKPISGGILSFCKKHFSIPLHHKSFGGIHSFQLFPIPHPAYFVRQGVTGAGTLQNGDYIELFYNKFKHIGQTLYSKDSFSAQNKPKKDRKLETKNSYYIRQFIYHKKNKMEKKIVFVLEETEQYLFGIDLKQIDTDMKDVLIDAESVLTSEGIKKGMRKYLKTKME